MTLFLPLSTEPPPPLPASPSFLVPSSDPAAHLSAAIQAILKAKRIVVICGAGISVQAGIPDFRSADGLFQSIKRENPKEAMSSGKELFDVSVFNSEQKTALFCQMIAQLSDLSEAAEPTSFHHVLRALDDSGKLLRVYTQNIDAIEQKSGLSFGVPEYERRRAVKSKSKSKKSPASCEALMQDGANPDHDNNNNNDNNTSASTSTSTRLPTPPSETETPRCIPLHGTLQSMHCQICSHTSPLAPFLASLTSGIPPACPSCTALEATRQLVGKRPRGIGRLRPSVVLYNEAHRDGEGVGEVVSRDLMGSKRRGKGRSAGADLLLVVGTSLRVPGTKRMVREFAKAVRSRAGVRDEQGVNGGSAKNSSSSGLATPAPSPRRSPAADEEASATHAQATGKSIKSVYLNLDFPVPTREWEGVFDAWIQGDAQEFAEVLAREIGRERVRKEGVEERKRERRREKEMQEQCEGEGEKTKKSAAAANTIPTPMSMKRKNAVPTTPTTPSPSSSLGSGSGSASGSGKRRKPMVILPISPPRTPLVRGRGVGVVSGAVAGAGAGAGAGTSSASGSAFRSGDAKRLGMGDEDETEDDESDDKRSRTPTPAPALTPTHIIGLSRKANGKEKEKEKAKANGKGKGKGKEREFGEGSLMTSSSSSSSRLYVLIPARSRQMRAKADSGVGIGIEDKEEETEGGKAGYEEKKMDQDNVKDHIKDKKPRKKKTKASPVYKYEVLPSSPYQAYPSQTYQTYQYQPYQYRYQDHNWYQGQYQHHHQHQHQHQRPRYSMSSQAAGMDVDAKDVVVVDMDVDVDVNVDGELDMDVDAGVKSSDKIDYEEEEEDVEVEVDIMNDWHYYDDVQYAPSLRYSQTCGRRSASPLQARTWTWTREREREPAGMRVGSDSGSSSITSSLPSSSPSATTSPSRVHAPHLSPRLALHPSPPPPPPPLLSTTTRLTERDRLGGRIEHSRTHLASHMARTLRSGRV